MMIMMSIFFFLILITFSASMVATVKPLIVFDMTINTPLLPINLNCVQDGNRYHHHANHHLRTKVTRVISTLRRPASKATAAVAMSPMTVTATRWKVKLLITKVPESLCFQVSAYIHHIHLCSSFLSTTHLWVQSSVN